MAQPRKTILGALFGNSELPEVHAKIDLSAKTIVDLSVGFVCAGIIVMLIYNKFLK